MDFPGSCLTGVLKVDNYHVVGYYIYEVMEDDHPIEACSPSRKILADPTFPASGLLPSRALDSRQDALLRRLEASCRRDKRLVTVVLERRQLWLFGDEANLKDHLRSFGIGWDDAGTAISQVDGLKIRKVKSGIFNSAALSRQASISSSSKANPASAPPAPASFEQKVSATRLANAKATSVNKSLSATMPTMTMTTESQSQDDLDDLEDPALIYMHFMASIMSLLSYCLTESLGYIPLNGRTLLRSLSPLDNGGLNNLIDNHNSRSSSISLTTLDVRLTTTGALLIVPKTILQPGLVSLAARAHKPEERSSLFGGEVWLAPGGKIARCLGPECSTEELSVNGYGHQEGPFSDTQLARLGASMVFGDAASRWKEDVILWLKQKGICIKNLHDVWARVEIWTASNEDFRNGVKAESRAYSRGTPRTILWPGILCFERAITDTTDVMLASLRLDELIGHQKGKTDPMEQCFQDPLAFAENWYARREARQQELRIKREVRQAEQTMPSSTTAATQYKSEEILSMTGVAMKQGTTADMSTTSGVYPTPPDGVQAQTLSGVTSFDPIETPTGNVMDSVVSGAEANSEPVLKQRNHDGSQMDLDVWPIPESRREGAHERKQSSATVFELGSGNFSTGDGGAFFGHLDEDMFNEIGVTEADFSFFDNPDLGDDDLFGDGTGSRQRINGKQSDVNDFNDMFGSPSIPQLGQARSLGSEQVSVIRTNSERLIKAGTIEHPAHQTPASIGSNSNQTVAKLNRRGTASLETEVEVPGDIQHSLSLQHDIKGQFISPPLSPDLVMKKLLPERAENIGQVDAPYRPKPVPPIKEREDANSSKSNSKPNGFDPIQFNSMLHDTKVKYDLEGRFWFSSRPDTEEVDMRDDEALPRLGLHVSQRESPSSHEQMELTGPSRGLTPTTSEVSSETINVCDAQNELIANQRHINQMVNALEDYSPRGGSLHLKRKRNIEDDSDSMVSSLQQLAFEPFRSSPECSAITPIPLDRLDGDPADWSMAGLFNTSVPEKKQIFELSDKEFIHTAQLVADQFLFGSLNSSWQGNYSETVLEGETPLNDALTHNGYYSLVEATVQEIFPQATECDLQSYVAVEDAQPVHPVCAPEPFSRSNSRSEWISSNSKNEMPQSSSSNPSIFKTQTPHVLVQRGDTRLQILPSALHFWESFGLGPCSGPKDITSFCVYPLTKSIEESVDDFLERMGSVYESCRFGRHRRGNVFAYNGGCVPVEINAPDPGGTSSVETAMQAVKDTCLRLGELLPNLDVEPQNVVIYLLNPFSHKDAIVDLCFAFLILFQTYLESPVVQQSKRVYEVVLQVVPLSFVFSTVTVPVPTPLQFFKLALEVYERCALTTTNAGDQVSFSRPSPAVLLAQSIPSRINFKLSSEPPQSLLDETCCLHIAYSCSVDDRWVSVAWSDSRGDLQTCTSFCLSRTEAPAYRRPFSEVAREVWETSVGMIQFKRVAWRFVLARVGVMNPEEIEVWVGLASQPTQPPSSLVVVSTDPCPPISLHTRTNIFPPNGFTPKMGIYTTPVSTPQPNTQSSDPPGNPGITANGAANAGTSIDLGAELEGDATIVDVMDDVWAVVLNHRLRNSNSVIDFQPALASGLLVKRGGPHEEDSPVCLGVNILHAYQSYRPLLKEILSSYRGLYTLARTRGTVDSVKSVLPWHIASAIKAQEALSSVM